MIRLVALSLLCWFGSAVAMVAQEPKDWANFGRYSQSNAEVEKPAKVVFMGNSITELWERTDPAFSRIMILFAVVSGGRSLRRCLSVSVQMLLTCLRRWSSLWQELTMSL